MLYLFIILVLCILLLSKYRSKVVISNRMSQPAGSADIGLGIGRDVDLVQCPQCPQPRFFKGQRGLNIHIGRSHKTFSQCVQPSTPAISVTTLPVSQSRQPFWLTLSKLKTVTPILKRIPRGARITVAQNLSDRIRKIIRDNSETAWEQLLIFSFQVLHTNSDTRISLTTKIKRNCSNPNTIEDESNNPGYGSHSRNTFKIFDKVESKVGDGDLRGAAQLLFSNDVIAPDSPETLSALIDKHPPSLAPILPAFTASSSPPAFLQVTEKEVMAAVMSFKRGSAGGLDGLSPQHLKDLLCGATGDTGRALLIDITALINLMLSGKVNEAIVPLIYGANLCALKKKDDGIRPIAVGCTFRRIASKVCCKHILPKLTELFQPKQLGFGSKGGCEAAVHALRTYLHKNGGEVLLKVDVKNAFNSVDRSTLLSEIFTHIPEAYNYLVQCYGQNSKLLYRSNLINSSTGCQQGDPLGPAIFSLAIQPIISALNSKLNMWYLDDGTLGGDVSTVLQDLAYLTDKFRSIGLNLNFSKCELYLTDLVQSDQRDEIIQNFNTLAPNIKILNKQTLRLLGAPILNESFPPFIQEQESKFEATTGRLLKIHAHVAFHIIRYCLFVPKFNYVLRCSPFWMFSDLLFILDEAVKNTLVQILNCNLSEYSWKQASLPIRFGGLGIRKISSVSLPAFLSSVHSTAELFNKIVAASIGNVPVRYLVEASDAWSMACPSEIRPKKPSIQRQWDEPLCKIVQNELISGSSNFAERARLLASGQHESGYWLRAVPSANIGTLLDNMTFSLAVALRLGALTNGNHRCPCGSEVDCQGHHGLSCRRSAGRSSRHASINDIIRRALATVNVPAILEPNGIARDDGKRPDGMSLIPWSRGRPLIWDATCADTLAPSHLQATSRAPGTAAETAENLKRRKYASLGDGYIFAPFGVETLGPWGPAALMLFKELSKRLVDATGDQRAGAYLGQRISLAIQRGNVASLLGTLPVGSDLNQVFYL